MALETHDLLRFLRSIVCKWPAIMVTLLTLKMATQNTILMGYIPIELMKLFELYMFKLDSNTNLRLCGVYFCWSELLMLHFFYEIAYYDFIDYILA